MKRQIFLEFNLKNYLFHVRTCYLVFQMFSFCKRKLNYSLRIFYIKNKNPELSDTRRLKKFRYIYPPFSYCSPDSTILRQDQSSEIKSVVINSNNVYFTRNISRLYTTTATAASQRFFIIIL